MKKPLLFGGLCLAGIATALIAGQQGQQPDPAQTAQEIQDRLRGQPQAAEPLGMDGAKIDQHFAECAAGSNLFEAQLGKFIAERVQNEEVKGFARRMVDDHTKAQEQLKETAQKAGIQVPDKLEPWQQTKLDSLEKRDPQNLAVDYAFHQVAAHHAFILESQRAMSFGQNAEIKSLASKNIPQLQAHLREANQIAMKFSGGRGIAGEAVGPAGERQGQQLRQQQPPTEQQK